MSQRSGDVGIAGVAVRRLLIALLLIGCLTWAVPARAGDHVRTLTAASSCLLGCGTSSWTHANAIDANGSTNWSSAYHAGSSAAEWFAFWFNGFQSTNYVRITPRRWNGASIAVPQFVDVYYSANSTWNFVARVPLAAALSPSGYTLRIPTVSTDGILLVTDTLRDDGFGGYYFQLDEANAGWSNRFYGWDPTLTTANGIPLQNFGLNSGQDRQHVACTYTSSGGSCDSTSAATFAGSNPGRLYMLGDEPDMVCTTPAQLATIYHNTVAAILAADSTARFSPPGFAQRNSACSGVHFIEYAQAFYNAYVSQYSAPPRVDEWRFHAFGFAKSYFGNCNQWLSSDWLNLVDDAAEWSNAKGTPMVLGSFGFPDAVDGPCDVVTPGWMDTMLTTIVNDPRIVAAVWWTYDYNYSAHPLSTSGGSLSSEGTKYSSYLSQ
jgi:hypothetical protein